MSAIASTARPAPQTTQMLLVVLKARTFIALILVFAFFAFAAPNFLSTANMVIMSKHVALNAFLAIGMTFVIVSGGIDLSVGSIVGLCGMVARPHGGRDGFGQGLGGEGFMHCLSLR